jgi:N-carbamoyl-L-amino-acid hydrolase
VIPSPLAERLAQLAALGATGHGIDRRLFSAEDAQARTLFVQWARGSKFTVEQDRAGNVFARRAGKRDGAAILSGSHLDTVPNGGAYDGAYGAVAALCALEELDAAGVVTEHPVEAVAWAGEEGSRFPLGCLGSGAFAGLNELASIDALRDDDGVTFADARAAANGLLAGVPVRDGFPRPAGYVELHIEQGPVLEHRGVRLGVVTAIAGQVRVEVEIHGEAGHAGTVPMELRRDALSAAAELALELEAAARTIGECVLTVGHLRIKPTSCRDACCCASMRAVSTRHGCRHCAPRSRRARPGRQPSAACASRRRRSKNGASWRWTRSYAARSRRRSRNSASARSICPAGRDTTRCASQRLRRRR